MYICMYMWVVMIVTCKKKEKTKKKCGWQYSAFCFWSFHLFVVCCLFKLLFLYKIFVCSIVVVIICFIPVVYPFCCFLLMLANKEEKKVKKTTNDTETYYSK